jgi:hypothetical protein
LECAPEIDVEDSMGTGKSHLTEMPGIYFFDM